MDEGRCQEMMVIFFFFFFLFVRVISWSNLFGFDVLLLPFLSG